MRKLHLIEAVCLVGGAGIGGGIMALPYLVVRTGFWPAVFIMIIAYAVSLILHIMVAELSIRTDYSSELLTVFTKHLFRGSEALRIAFYVLMAVTLVCNLAAYVTGAGEILAELMGISVIAAETLFFAAAAIVVFLGLKRLAINETAALALMVVLLAVLVVQTIRLPAHEQLAPARREASPLLAVYGMAVFCLSSLFAVPQAASGLCGSAEHRLQNRRLLLAVGLGLLINLFVMITVVLCTLLGSSPVTEVAIVGWAASLGGKMHIFGSLFIALAMLTSFWSISLQLSDMTKEFFRAGRFFSWLAATAPSFLLALRPLSGFLALMQIAGGATAVVIAFMVVPAYRNAVQGIRQKPGGDELLLGTIGNSVVVCAAVVIMYVLVAVGSFL